MRETKLGFALRARKPECKQEKCGAVLRSFKHLALCALALSAAVLAVCVVLVAFVLCLRRRRRRGSPPLRLATLHWKSAKPRFTSNC